MIYFIQSEKGGPIKIGRVGDANRELLKLQKYSPFKLVLLGQLDGDQDIETEIKEKFKDHLSHSDWYYPYKALLDFIRENAHLPPIAGMIGSEAHINSDSKVTKKVKPIEYAPQPIVSTDERFVSENEVARITGLSVQTLRNNRFKHRGIPYHKVGRRVLYKIKDVYKYLEGHRIKPVG